MKHQKFAASLLAATLACTQLASAAAVYPAAPYTVTVSAESVEPYFYNQLPDDAILFYDAIDEMYRKGMLKTGNANLDLTETGYLTQAQAESLAENGAAALSMFGAARDAFKMEHTDTFYVDFDSFSIRVTHDGERYHVYLGTGRRDSYYATGFENASEVENTLAAYHAAISEIVAEAEAIEPKLHENPTAAKVRFVHDYITHNTSYRLENVCKPQNLGLIRNACGPLIGGEGVCEGYSRAFKAVLDEMGIPCVLVNGVFKHDDGTPELHMWTAVQIDGVWYGVDPTMDDPVPPARSVGEDGYESHQYLLVGSGVMDVRHAASGVISDVNFEFAYPQLSLYKEGEQTVSGDSALNIRYTQTAELDGEQVDAFYVSYMGMGLEAARDAGYYLLCKMEDYRGIEPEWFYVVDYYDELVDTETEMYQPIPGQITSVQYAITEIPFEMYDVELGIADSVFYGTDADILDTSAVYYNSNGGYVPPPYPRTVTPTMTEKVYVNDGTKHVSITYTDNLVPVDGEEPGVVVDCAGPTALQNTKIENFAWDGESTVTFDFTPSPMWADDNVIYTLTLSGLVGELSGKTPVAVKYGVGNKSSYCALRANGYNWNVFGKPQLLDNSDVSMNGWETADGTPVDMSLRSRMVLVASETSPEQTAQMNDLMQSENSSPILKSTTYNISLSICNCMIVKTGEGIHVSLGFPEGYGPDDAGVTFKVYHFKVDDSTGEVIGVEEIPCIVTKYGLVVLCQSFSPYAVVAVADDGTQTNEKTIAVTNSTGGTVIGGEGFITLSEGDTVTLQLQADDGYVVDAVTVDGNHIELTKDSTMTLEIGYDDFASQYGIVDVIFAAESVVAAEEARGETPVHLEAQAAEDVTAPAETTTTTVTTTVTTQTTAETSFTFSLSVDIPAFTTTAEETTTTTTETTTSTTTTTITTEATTSTTTTETTTVTETTTRTETSATETTTKATETTTVTEATTTTPAGDLPQTGYPRASAALYAAIALLGAGGAAMGASGAIRRKREDGNTAD